MEELKKKQFLNYINVFRGLAILLIIMGHTMQIGTNQSLTHKIICEIVCGGTALFIFISGFLFQHLSYKFEYKNYLSKKWTNVIMPYLFTSIPGLLLCFVSPVTYKNTFDGLSIWLQIPIHISIGRVHNIPTWFISMIAIFFLLSFLFLKLEKKNWLYKTLPFLFLVTIFLPRGLAEYENLIGLSFSARYFAYVAYIISGFVHFLSLYIFGMYCSSNKSVIDVFYKKRVLLWSGMIITSILDIYLSYKQIYCNCTISKTFLTMLLLGYLKHYDEFILSHKKTNTVLDFVAKYSFGLFFVHWYWFFGYNQFFHLENVVCKTTVSASILTVLIRFVVVSILSLMSLFFIKLIILKFDKDANTRKFIGI